MILIKTHGGLGNQLFQVFFALALSNKIGDDDLYIFHNSSYKHRFNLSLIFNQYAINNKNLALKIISSLRIPKILTKVHLETSGCLRFGSKYLLDGYFQDIRYYEQFDKTNILFSIERLRRLVCIDRFSQNRALYHFRLGDFFPNQKQETQFIAHTIETVMNGSDIITSNDSLFKTIIDVNSLLRREIKLIETAHLESIDVLRLMSNYKTVFSNSSTLALWSTIFSGGKFISNNPKTDEIKDYITSFISGYRES